MPKTFSSLRYPAFRFYFGTIVFQMAALNMGMMVRALLLYRLTGSVALLGMLALAQAVPNILLSLFGGVLADRIPKKYIIILGQTGTVVTYLVIALSLTLGFLSAERAGSWWILIATSAISSIFASLVLPSRQAIIVEMVGADQVMNAISLRNLGRTTVRLGAPALAGVLIDVFDFELVYYLITGIGFISLILTMYLPMTGKWEEKSSNVISELKDGLKYIRGETNILFLLVFTTMMGLLSMSYLRFMPVFIDDILKVGATGMGILLSASAIGSSAGSLVLASIPSRRRGAILMTSVVILGIALAGFAFSHNWYFSLAFIILVGIGHAVRTTLSNTLIQSYAAPAYLGRVMSFYTMEIGFTSLGIFGAAMLAEVIGVPWTVAGFALALVPLSLLSLVFFPRVWKLD